MNHTNVVSGFHRLACKPSAWMHFRHEALKDLVGRALQASGVPCPMKLSGLTRSDGKRQDEIEMLICRLEKSLS